MGGSDGLGICNEADNTNAATTIITIIIAIMITKMMTMIVFQQMIKCVQGGDS